MRVPAGMVSKRQSMRAVAAAAAIAVALAPGGAAAQSKKGEAKGKREPVKIEKLACELGTEWNHARIAVQLANGKVNEFAYYSIWKPRTCSLHVTRGDAYS